VKLEQFFLLAAFAPVVLIAIAGVLYLLGLFAPVTSSGLSLDDVLGMLLFPFTVVVTPLFLLAYLSYGLSRPRFWVLVGVMLAAYILSFLSYSWFVDFPAAPYFWFALPAVITFLAGYALGRSQQTKPPLLEKVAVR
jgi:hypothetical protein